MSGNWTGWALALNCYRCSGIARALGTTGLPNSGDQVVERVVPELVLLLEPLSPLLSRL